MTARSDRLKAEAAAMHAVEEALGKAEALSTLAYRRVLSYHEELLAEHHARLTAATSSPNGDAPAGPTARGGPASEES